MSCSALAAAHVVLAVIGPKWVALADDNGRRRIANHDDWVRQEVELAFIYQGPSSPYALETRPV